MKTLTFASGIALIALPLSAAQAGILTIGEGFARSCFESSEAQMATPATIEACNRAFSEQALAPRDEVATHVNRGILYYLSGNLGAAGWLSGYTAMPSRQFSTTPSITRSHSASGTTC